MTDRELMQQALDDLVDIKVEDGIDCVATILALRARLATCDRCGKVNPAELHTCTPPQREWVGLTDEELHALHFELKVQTMGGINTLGMYRILEKALREKNG